MNCPICNKAGINKGAERCPQCDSDFTAINILEELKFAHSKRKRISISIYFLILLVLSTVFFLIINFNFNINTNRSAILIDSSNIYKTTINNLNQQLDSLSRSNKFFFYKVKKGDNIYKIANAFSNVNEELKQIVKDNNLYSPYLIKPGQFLKIDITKK